ncbi:hypothetical protein Bhyg_04246, partial [Pseudolycoriella hygida]
TESNRASRDKSYQKRRTEELEQLGSEFSQIIEELTKIVDTEDPCLKEAHKSFSDAYDVYSHLLQEISTESSRRNGSGKGESPNKKDDSHEVLTLQERHFATLKRNVEHLIEKDEITSYAFAKIKSNLIGDLRNRITTTYEEINSLDWSSTERLVVGLVINKTNWLLDWLTIARVGTLQLERTRRSHMGAQLQTDFSDGNNADGGIPTKNWSVQNDEERYTRRLEEISRTVQTVVQTMKMGRCWLIYYKKCVVGGDISDTMNGLYEKYEHKITLYEAKDLKELKTKLHTFEQNAAERDTSKFRENKEGLLLGIRRAQEEDADCRLAKSLVEKAATKEWHNIFVKNISYWEHKLNETENIAEICRVRKTNKQIKLLKQTLE